MSFWRRFFQSNNPRDLFFKFNPAGSTWRVVHWNAELEKSHHRNLTLEVQGQQHEIIRWDNFGEKSELRFYRDDGLLLKTKTHADDELKHLMNIGLHSLLKFSLEGDQPFMLEPVSGVTAMDFQNEARAQQWIQASFGTLMRAMDQFENKSDLILTASIFSGKVPDSQEHVLRVLAFNLDIFYYLEAEGNLRIMIFDDKDKGHGVSKTPAFHQIIKVTKPQFYDEISKLVHRIAKVGEIR